MTERQLAVFLFGERAGSLRLENGKLQFRYETRYLAEPRSLPLSISLPLREARFDDDLCRPFFAGLLPEGSLRVRLAKILHISRRNDFALLDGLGGECAGAVTLLEDGADIEAARQPSAPRWLGEDELTRLWDTLLRRPMLVGEQGLRLSLAGAQDKLPVLAEEKDGQVRLALPPQGSPSSHILKPQIRDLSGSAHNEAFCLALASASGILAARARLQCLPASGLFFLLVERYDRSPAPDGRFMRLHQEDFCQALGTPPEYKYQNDGGPDLAACFKLLRSAAKPAATEVLRLLDAVIFNALVGNNDAHAKNFSLLYSRRQPTLAPLYDVLCTAVYPELNDKMAMKIGGKYHFNELFPRHWESFALNSGLSKALVKKRVLFMAQLLPRQIPQLMARFAAMDAEHDILKDIAALIAARCAMTEQRLAS